MGRAEVLREHGGTSYGASYGTSYGATYSAPIQQPIQQLGEMGFETPTSQTKWSEAQIDVVFTDLVTASHVRGGGVRYDTGIRSGG